jgi:hypothetical protein
MNMKIATNKNVSSRLFNRAPINFWEPVAVEQSSTIKNDDSICHEVKYNPTDKASELYKMYMTAFSHGMPEQWLKFMENLNVVITGNGLDENGRARFNLTRSSLKGDALHIFNDKAAEQEKETKDSHIKCLRAIMEQVFPKDNPLQKQKTYMRNHVFLHLNDKQVSEFCARWKEINNCLDEFPPFQPNQHFLDDQVKEILYSIIPKCWQSYLHREDKFNMTKASVDDFFDLMELLIPRLNNKTNQKLIKTIIRSQRKSRMTKRIRLGQRKMIPMRRHPRSHA